MKSKIMKPKIMKLGRRLPKSTPRVLRSNPNDMVSDTNIDINPDIHPGATMFGADSRSGARGVVLESPIMGFFIRLGNGIGARIFSHLACLSAVIMVMGISFPSKSAWFVIHHLTVEGHHYASAEYVQSLAGINVGDSLLNADPDTIRRRVLSGQWIDKAVVQRYWGGTMHIRVQEKRPMALWRGPKGVFLIDRNGSVISESPDRRFAGLPLVVGYGAHRAAFDIITMMEQSPLPGYRMRSLVFVSSRRWDVHFSGNKADVVIRLPAKDSAKAWQRFLIAQDKHHFLDRDIVSVDVRFPDRLIVGMDRAIPTRPEILPEIPPEIQMLDAAQHPERSL